MTNPTPLPIDVSGISEPLPDPAHESIRAHVLDAVQAVWTNHLGLLAQMQTAQGQLGATQQALAAAQQALAALEARVTALENPTPPPAPTPTTQEARADGRH